VGLCAAATGRILPTIDNSEEKEASERESGLPADAVTATAGAGTTTHQVAVVQGVTAYFP